MVVLVFLLRAAWIAGILPILIAAIPSQKIKAFHDLVMEFAKRGKITPSQKFTVPQRFFSHFYIVGVLWTTILLVATWHYAYKSAPDISEPFIYSSYLTGVSHEFPSHSHLSSRKNKYMIWKSVVLLLLMEAQVLRRLFETIYVFKYSPSARMHIMGYLTGLFFYTAAPLSLCCAYAPEVFKFVLDLVEEFVAKGKDNMQLSEFDLWGHVNPLMQLKWHVWIGAAIFLFGWIHQRRCHAILGLLKEKKGQVDDYAIPCGDWFEYVSSAHYLAEIVIYGGIAVASGISDLTIWLIFGFVVTNLAFAAGETHTWYLRKFDNFPRERFAIVPYVY